MKIPIFKVENKKRHILYKRLILVNNNDNFNSGKLKNLAHKDVSLSKTFFFGFVTFSFGIISGDCWISVNCIGFCLFYSRRLAQLIYFGAHKVKHFFKVHVRSIAAFFFVIIKHVFFCIRLKVQKKQNVNGISICFVQCVGRCSEALQ